MLRGTWPALATALLLTAPAAGKPPLEHFFAAPELRGFKISPDGTHLAAISPKDDDWRLVILALDPIRIVQEIAAKKRPIHDFWWVNDDRLVLSLSWDKGKSERLAGANRKGSRTFDFGDRLLKAGRSPRHTWFMSTYPKSEGNVLVEMRFDPGRQNVYTPYSGLVSTEVRRLNAYNGASTVVAGSNVRGFGWLPDPEGEIRFGYAQVHDDGYYLYRDPGDLTFRSIRTVRGMDVDQLNFVPLGFTPGETKPIVASRHETDRFALYAYDVDKDIFSEVLYAHPRVDVVGPALRSRDGSIEGVLYRDDEWQVFWIDPVWRERAERIQRALPDTNARIVDWDEAESTFVVLVQSERRPPLYLLYREGSKKLEPLSSLYKALRSDDLVESRRLDYKARDGRTIPAYLTTPAHAGGGPLPVIVSVHDGPWSPTHWIRFFHGRAGSGFDAERQFLASRGWAVFQPNYRGSSGFGHAHQQAGLGGWGTAMQDDLEDGVRWLVSQGIADPKRICIYGHG